MMHRPGPHSRPRGGLRRALGRFRRDERGSFTVEMLLILPLLVWACLAILTFMDGYRAQISNARITYAMGDMISRWQEKSVVDNAYLDGLMRIYDYLAMGDENAYMRVTSVIWDKSNEEHILLFSEPRQSAPETYSPPDITQQTLDQIVHKIPTLSDGDSVILVETWLDYTPPFAIGIGARRFNNHTVVSPRFVGQIKGPGA